MRRVAVTLVIAAVLAGCGGSAKRTSSQATPGAGPGRLIGVVIGSSGRARARIVGDGSLATSTTDGHRGWFIAGAFTRVDGVPERGLARVLPDGRVDPGWHGTLVSSGQSALLAAGGTLYVAGTIAGQDRSRLLALDARTGRLRSSLPAPPGPVTALALAGSRLVVATSTSTDRRRPGCVEAIDLRSGSVDRAWGAEIRRAPELGCVDALAPSGGWVYLAGAFRGGGRRLTVARVGAGSGLLDPRWRPPAAMRPAMAQAVAVSPDAVLVAGSSPGPGIASLAPATGAPQPGWRPPPAVRNVLSLAVLDRRLLATGDFPDAVALLHLPDGSPLRSWRPPAGQAAGAAAASGSAVLLGLRRR